jgi:hypothetical protein
MQLLLRIADDFFQASGGRLPQASMVATYTSILLSLTEVYGILHDCFNIIVGIVESNFGIALH